MIHPVASGSIFLLETKSEVKKFKARLLGIASKSSRIKTLQMRSLEVCRACHLQNKLYKLKHLGQSVEASWNLI